jgi:hypothetical protein
MIACLSLAWLQLGSWVINQYEVSSGYSDTADTVYYGLVLGCGLLPLEVWGIAIDSILEKVSPEYHARTLEIKAWVLRWKAETSRSLGSLKAILKGGKHLGH